METIRPPFGGLILINLRNQVYQQGKCHTNTACHSRSREADMELWHFLQKGFLYFIQKNPKFLIFQSALEKSTQILGKTEIKKTTQQFFLKSLATADDFNICPNYLFHFYCTSTWSLKSSIQQKPRFIFHIPEILYLKFMLFFPLFKLQPQLQLLQSSPVHCILGILELNDLVKNCSKLVEKYL